MKEFKFYILDDEIISIKDISEYQTIEDMGFEIYNSLEEAEDALLEILKLLVEKYTAKIESITLHKNILKSSGI